VRYTPFGFWDDLDVYVEVAVEKLDLRNLFEPVCAEFFVPITNFKGWSDLNSRAAIMRRFAEHERSGRQCVLLLCGDHDPGGLAITVRRAGTSKTLRGPLAGRLIIWSSVDLGSTPTLSIAWDSPGSTTWKRPAAKGSLIRAIPTTTRLMCRTTSAVMARANVKRTRWSWCQTSAALYVVAPFSNTFPQRRPKPIPVASRANATDSWRRSDD
jgi:hypothetical protein